MRKSQHSVVGVAVWLVATVWCSASWAATIEIGTVEARRGEDIEISVVLRSAGEDVAGTENEIAFDRDIQLLKCLANPEIDRAQTVFSSFPGGCSVEECTSVKTLVLSFSNLSPIPDGSTLYSCTVRVSPDAEPGTHVLRCSKPGGSTPDGDAVDTTCRDGSIVVSDAPPVATRPITVRPTRTLRPTRTPAPTALPSSTPNFPGDLDLVFVDVAPFEIESETGGDVRITAHTVGSAGEGLNGADVQFEVSPRVGGLEIIAGRTRSVMLNDRLQHGIAEAVLRIPPGAPTGKLAIAASSFGRIGTEFVSVVTGAAAAPVRRVVVQAFDYCGRPSDDPIELSATVLDEDETPIGGRRVLFSAEIGQLSPVVARTERAGSHRGVAHTMLTVPADFPIRTDPSTGAILPYAIRARTSGVEGVAQIFLAPGRDTCGNSAPPTLEPHPASDDSCAVIRPGRRTAPAWLLLAAGGVLFLAHRTRPRPTETSAVATRRNPQGARHQSGVGRREEERKGFAAAC